METSVCQACGRPLVSDRCTYCENSNVFRIVQREIVLLVILCAITTLLFFFTRRMAGRSREMEADNAVTWYQRGQEQLQAGNMEEAATSFRNATANGRTNPQYTLALASALSGAGRLQEAQQVLVQLRETAPERGEVNLDLARLTAQQGQLEDAVRYYHTALYGIWPPDGVDLRLRQIRVELIRFLLNHDDSDRALSELLTLSRDVPEDDGRAQAEIAQLFFQANDAQHARDHFALAIRAEPDDTEALAGAGRAEFALQNYVAARRYLRTAVSKGATSAATKDLLETVQFVLSEDPLADGLSINERTRRLNRNIDHSIERIDQCVFAGGATEVPPVQLETLRAELEAAKPQLRLATLRRNPDLIQTNLNLAYRVELATAQMCGEPTPLDRALVLIAERHVVVEQ